MPCLASCFWRCLFLLWHCFLLLLLSCRILLPSDAVAVNILDRTLYFCRLPFSGIFSWAAVNSTLYSGAKKQLCKMRWNEWLAVVVFIVFLGCLFFVLSGDLAYLTLDSCFLLPSSSSSKAIKGLFSCHNGNNFGVLIWVTMLCKMLFSADVEQG